MGDILFIDFETRSTVDLKKAGADVYARHPSTEVNCFAWAFDDEPVVCDKKQMLPSPRVYSHVKNGGTVVAHNAAFEWLVWNYSWEKNVLKLPELKWEQLICTMELSYVMGLPGALEKVAPAVGLGFHKDGKGKRVMMQLSKPKEIHPDGKVEWYEPETYPEKFQALYDYCKTDVEVERELYQRLLPLSEFEKKVRNLDHKINQRGIKIDLKALHSAQALIEFEQKRLDKAIRQVTKNVVACCSEIVRLTSWIKNEGVELEGIAKEDILELLEQETLPSHVRSALLIRQEYAKTSTAKVISALSSVCEDGRLRSIHQYHGAPATGRWAGRRIQPQNLPRSSIPQGDIEDVFSMLRNLQ